MQDSLRIGCVKYLNARPLIRGWSGNVTLDHPAALCVQLARGDLDVALVSSFEFLRNPIYRIVEGISISSDGPVYSVVVALRGEISDVDEIELDPAAETSVNLLRCLLAERQLNPRLVRNIDFQSVRPAPNAFGAESATADRMSAVHTSSPQDESVRLADNMPMFQTSFDDRVGRLLIGDQAVRFRQKHTDEFKFWDLGEAWKKLFNLPFVYALWLIRPEVVDAKTIADQLRALRDENLANIDQLIAEEKDFDRDFCARYYREHLRFSFGEKEREGLRDFQRLCQKHGLLPKGPLEFDLV